MQTTITSADASCNQNLGLCIDHATQIWASAQSTQLIEQQYIRVLYVHYFFMFSTKTQVNAIKTIVHIQIAYLN